MVASVNITIVTYNKHSRHDGNVGALVEVIKLNVVDLLSLEEGSGVLDIEHLAWAGGREEKESIASNHIGLLVVPAHLKTESLLSDKWHFKLLTIIIEFYNRFKLNVGFDKSSSLQNFLIELLTTKCAAKHLDVHGVLLKGLLQVVADNSAIFVQAFCVDQHFLKSVRKHLCGFSRSIHALSTD